MKNKLLTVALAAALLAALWAGPAAPALAQSADLHNWTAAGDVAIDSAGTARLTTAYFDEAPVSAGAALLFDALESAPKAAALRRPPPRGGGETLGAARRLFLRAPCCCRPAAWPPTRSKARACS